jgi:hypothetical protein
MEDCIINFNLVGERTYYANIGINNKENKVFIGKYLLSYFINGGFLYVYYIGNYYVGNIGGFDISKIDIIQTVIKQCNDSRLFSPENIGVG